MPYALATSPLFLAACLLAASGLIAIAVGIQGYRALTREDIAARIVVRPTGVERFRATVHLAACLPRQMARAAAPWITATRGRGFT